jgi:hypothetical protein
VKAEDAEDVCPGIDPVCPGCHRPLKLPRVGRDDAKPLVCGGCGQRFDCGDLSSPAEGGNSPA